MINLALNFRSTGAIVNTVGIGIDTALAAGMGAANTVLDTWAGAGVMHLAGHPGYELKTSQLSNAALVGLPYGVANYALKKYVAKHFPNLNRPDLSKSEKFLISMASYAAEVGGQALTGMVASEVAKHRGDANYLSVDHGAVSSAVGETVTGAVILGVFLTLATCCGVGILAAGGRVAVRAPAPNREDLEMNRF